MLEHEYSAIGGFNRAHIGRLLGMVAAGIAAGVSVAVAWALQKAKAVGLAVPDVVQLPLTGTVIFLALYFYFNSSFWKLKKVSAWLKVPDLSGEWLCNGQTINPDKTPGPIWNGVVTIRQSWDKIRVSLKTAQSTSDSISASVVHDASHGFRLMYSYRNQPGIGQDMQAHFGYATFTFDSSLREADGEYFNGNGRYTFGTMKLSRKV